jgi:N-acetylglucosamine-6-phosphate deacetylase
MLGHSAATCEQTRSAFDAGADGWCIAITV